jgi:hypothetical protein
MRGSNAGIAQLVEHDLAKVGVASSSLVSRSSFQQSPDLFGALSFQPVRCLSGHGAKNWIGRGVLAIHKPLPSAMIRCSDAGIAQLVEHDLAKVGVASSSLVSRSSFQQSLGSPGFCFFEATCDRSRSRCTKQWPGGRVVMQRPAKPRTPVRFRPWPPLRIKTQAPPGAFFFGLRRASGQPLTPAIQ